MVKDFDQRVEQYLNSLSEHELVVVIETEKIQSYYIKKPGTRIMSTLVTFTPEGIVLQGDFTPNLRGSVSAIGYDRHWFAGKNCWSYLAEKFLKPKWSQEVAVEELRGPAWREGEPPNVVTQLDELANEVEHFGAGLERIGEVMCDLGFDVDSCPGWGYDPNEAAALAAIQRKFSDLWWAEHMKT